MKKVACLLAGLVLTLPLISFADTTNPSVLANLYIEVLQLAEKISLVLRDDHLRNRLTANAVERSKEFDWDVAAGKTMEVIDKVLFEYAR